MTAVEWLEDCLIEQHPNGSFVWNTRADLEALFEQAKEMEKQQQNEFAIGFAEWCIKKRIDFFDDTEIGRTYTINGFVSRYKMNELLEMFKKEQGL